MAQFGAAKNPPWARTGASVSNSVNLGTQILSQPGVATPTVFSLGSTTPSLATPQYTAQQISVIQQQQAAAAVLQVPGSMGLPQVQPGVALPTSLSSNQVATVSYPAPRATGAQPTPKQRVFTGQVTKLHENFGFVDEDVFFQTSVVKGTLPRVGDRVLVEASYNANMPFKWNATRIQVLPNQAMGGPSALQQQQAAQQAMLKVAPPGITPSITPAVPNLSQPPPPLMGHGRASSNQSIPNQRGGRDRFSDRDSREGRGNRDHRNERGQERERRSPRKRSRSPVQRRARSRSPARRSPPRRRPNRIVPRYMVQIPKLLLDTTEAVVMTLKQRYQNLYIPSDFFQATFSWVDAFPAHRTLQIGNHCAFHVAHKEVDALTENDAILEPPDADHLYSAKVMLLASPSREDIYHKSCALADDVSEMRENFQHPTRLLQFLVGLKGKSEPMAIGGPWSPSLDGPNPGEDPRVLIKTAIRTTRALTGLDLSVCTQWYRFTEIHYHRPEETHKGRLVPARVETTVIFLPDVWSCQPTRLEWEGLQSQYKSQLTDKLSEESNEDHQDEEEEAAADGGPKEPSHFSELDPKTMKVSELRHELEARTLSSKGLKSQLIARLLKATKCESEKETEEKEKKEEEGEPEEEKEPEKMEVDERDEERKKKEDEEKKRREDREKAARERRYTLPENPAIIVHPSTTAKSGKFDCTTMSLSVLLDYRPEDNKEHSFEVSLFAELFNEMLMRDFGFTIYKGLMVAPDRRKEEEEEKKREKEKKEKEEKEAKKDDSKEPSSKKARTDDGDSDKTSKKDDKESKTEDDKDKKDDKESDKKDDDKDDKKRDERRKDSKERSSSSKDRDKDKDKKDKDKKEKLKYRTIDPALLLAFVYFDQSHSGYLMDKDVEDILHTLGLSLSRSQVKKLVQKQVTRDTLNYRKITDKPLSTKPKEGEKADKEVKTDEVEVKKETADEADLKTQVKSEPSEDTHVADGIPTDDVLSLGNKPLLLSDVKKEPLTPTGRGRRSVKKAEGEQQDASSGMVMYNGSLLDIGSVMTRLEKSENSRKAVEAKMKDTQTEIDDLKSSFSSSEQNSQKVALELQELKKKLRDQRKATDAAESNSKKYHGVLNRSLDNLTSLLKEVRSTLDVTEPKENGDS
ncbi:unnamed protein product [Owenia fusiformis]|uniref:Uncharacterized protein n=1 Tax=Owenia fusiformis TaxID=6347 RepID=A0A8J1UK96_OWEFU|nr:unnamed protein product [Owenia fusiformis]